MAGKCEICKTRPKMVKAQMQQRHGVGFPYCEPCLIEADWENVHSDDAHESYANGDWAPEKLEDGLSLQAEMKDCWICHPELNQAAKDYQTRNGSSRKGIIMIVPIRATGQEKAKVVADRLADRFATRISTRKGITTLTLEHAGEVGFKLRWDGQGRYLYTESIATVNGKSRKVRNVSEALRLVA